MKLLGIQEPRAQTYKARCRSTWSTDQHITKAILRVSVSWSSRTARLKLSKRRPKAEYGDTVPPAVAIGSDGYGTATLSKQNRAEENHQYRGVPDNNSETPSLLQREKKVVLGGGELNIPPAPG